jgi:hypothetical protein
MSGDIFPLVVGLIIIGIFLLSIEILNKRLSEQKKISKYSNKFKEKIK